MPDNESQVNPWVRADMERFNPETLALIPLSERHEYAAGMQNLEHWKTVFGTVMEQLNAAEEWRHGFFARQTGDASPLEIDVGAPPRAA